MQERKGSPGPKIKKKSKTRVLKGVGTDANLER